METLDKCFENVCELDLIFHVDKVGNAHESFRAEYLRHLQSLCLWKQTLHEIRRDFQFSVQTVIVLFSSATTTPDILFFDFFLWLSTKYEVLPDAALLDRRESH